MEINPGRSKDCAENHRGNYKRLAQIQVPHTCRTVFMGMSVYLVAVEIGIENKQRDIQRKNREKVYSRPGFLYVLQ